MKVMQSADLHRIGDHSVAMESRWVSVKCRDSRHEECVELFPVAQEWMTCSCSCHGSSDERILRLPSLLEAQEKKPAMRRRQRKQERDCACGCDGVTKGGLFLPGHDAKLRSQLLAMTRSADDAQRASAQQRAMQFGWSL